MKRTAILVALLVTTFASQPSAQPPNSEIDAATRAYLDRLSPEEKARSDAYFEGGYWLALVSFVYSLGVAWVFLGTGLSRKLRDFAARRVRIRSLRTAIYSAGYVVGASVLTFPLLFYRGFVREHRYDLSNQSFGPWMKDQLTALGVQLVIFVLLLVLLYGVFRRAPRTWWLWGAVTSLSVLVVVSLLAPIYIFPLFNEYRPLSEPGLRQAILEMARANGVPADEVYQFDASRQSKRISANVSGFMSTLRVSLNDNLLARCSEAEVRAVMGHEIGHYVLNHVYEGLVFFGVVLASGFAVLKWSYEAVQRRYGERWGIGGIEDEAGLPLLAALLSTYFFAVAPLTNSFVRANEAEADIFGLNASREPDGFAEVSLKLGEYRKLDPGPIEEWIFFDHPSGRSRIQMAMRWKVEQAETADGP
jgi:STE24 endopeptidase